MDYSVLFLKKLYSLQRELNKLNERERLAVLLLVLGVIFFLWNFMIYGFQVNALKQVSEQINTMQNQIFTVQTKKTQIESMSSTPEIQQLLKRHEDLKYQLAELDKRIVSFNKRYISPKDLDKVLRDMVKETNGVKIVSMSTTAMTKQLLSPDPTSATPTTPDAQAPQNPNIINVGSLQAEPKYYHLVLKGGFFAIMNYLQHIEQLSWRLYWDSFDYTVSKYPEGVAVITFYTLKPVLAQPNAPGGGAK